MRQISSSVFALGTSIGHQGALLVSGIGTAWLVGDVGRGILAYGATIGTLFGILATGGASSAAAISIADSGPGTRPSMLRHAKETGGQRALIAALISSIAIWYFRDQITHGFTAIFIGCCAAAAGLVILQLFVGTSQGLGYTNGANAIRLVPPIAYAIGVLLVILFTSGSGEHLVGPVALAWAASWILSLAACGLLAQRFASDTQGAPKLSNEQRSTFRTESRALFLGSVSTYELLRVDLLAATLLLPTKELGIYAVSMAFTGLLKAMATSFGVASLGDSLKDGVLPMRALLMRGLTVVAAAVVLIAIIPLAVKTILPDEFATAATAARLLVGAAACAAIRRSIVEVTKPTRPEIGSVTEVLQLVVLFALGALLPREAGSLALATLIAMALSCLTSVVWFGFSDLADRPEPLPERTEATRPRNEI